MLTFFDTNLQKTLKTNPFIKIIYNILDETEKQKNKKYSMLKKTSLNPYRDYPKNQFSNNTTVIPNGIIWYYLFESK